MYGIKIMRATCIINVLAQQQRRRRRQQQQQQQQQGQLQTAQEYKKNTQRTKENTREMIINRVEK